MASFSQVLEVNWIILYSVYGQVFFIMGLVTALLWRRHSRLPLARPLPWLAAFGIAHGLNEWGYIFIPLQALYLDEAVVRLMGMCQGCHASGLTLQGLVQEKLREMVDPLLEVVEDAT